MVLLTLLPFVKLHFLFPQKGLDHIDMDALTDVKKGIIRYPAFASIDEYFLIFYVETQMQMARCRLHAVDQAVGIEQRSATLAPQAGRAQFNSGSYVVIARQSGNNSINRKAGRNNASRGGPLNIIDGRIIPKISKFRKGVA